MRGANPWGAGTLVDIPGNSSTTTTVTVGSTTINTLETVGDHDWFRINLTQGQAITVALNGRALDDPYLRIRDSSGNIIFENDDANPGVNLDLLLSFAASYTGVYYIDVGAWNEEGAGDYQLNVTAFQTPPVFTNDQIADQLSSGYWGGVQHPFNVTSGGSLTVNIIGLNAAGQALARQALQSWSEIIGISFVESTSSTPHIMFTDDDPDGGAFTEGLAYNGNFVTRALVNIDTSWLINSGSNIGSYGYQTYLHEIGHALGLGHAGNYNETATYPYDALFRNDAWSTSIMSYFGQTESTYFDNLGFSQAYIVTPMVADIIAVSQLYGLSTTTRSGNTTYGFNNTAGALYTSAISQNNGYTIFDTGGTDTLDYSGFAVAQRIDLNAEAFSNVGGLTGNVTIARGTIIENAIGGSRSDVIIGNSIANTLTGRGGNDTLSGGLGYDTFKDSASGLNGDIITDFSGGDRIVITDATAAGFTFNITGNTLNFTGGQLNLSTPITGGALVASAAAGGGVQLAIQVRDVASDFNGDGRSDVLWHSSTGRVTNWIGQANGGFVGNFANADGQAGTDWHVMGVGDFNGDSRDDVLWRNNDGSVTNWLSQANGSFTSNFANAYGQVDTSWSIAGVGDFNGDGRDDVLWHSDTGRVTNWLAQVTGGFVGNFVNADGQAGTDWHVVGVGDFNGDGRDDVLWRNDDGSVTNWVGQANGGFTSNFGNAYGQVDTSWSVAGVGDFNGDGRDDVLWHSDTGRVTNWLAQANGGFVSNFVNADGQAGTDWHVAGVGDFNGDGRDDVLWRNNDGSVTNWLGQANGAFASNFGNAYGQFDTNWQVRPHDSIWL